MHVLSKTLPMAGSLKSDLLQTWGFPGGSVVKICLPMQETWVRSLGWEDPLEEEMTTHSQYSYLRNPMHRGAWEGYSPWGCKRVEHD